MAIEYQLLGDMGRDNALWVRVNSGQSLHRLLFDCGEGCLNALPVSEIQQVAAAFYSHFHVDHISGFDGLLRHNFARPESPLRLFGPVDALRVLSSRLQGFTWNLVSDCPGEVHVTAISEQHLRQACYLTREGFAREHPLEPNHPLPVVWSCLHATVSAIVLDHGIPCLGYLVREADKLNVDASVLADLGLQPGPWLKQVKDAAVPDDLQLDIRETTFTMGTLRQKLLRTEPGDSIAYLTDFRIEEGDIDRLVTFLAPCQTLVCENNYRNEDIDVARKTRHLVSREVAELAARVNPEQLMLFHVSDRYSREEIVAQLSEVQAVFPRSSFPRQWNLT